MTVVLDEADEMLKMGTVLPPFPLDVIFVSGFAEAVETILNEMPATADRQTLLFSATVFAVIYCF